MTAALRVPLYPAEASAAPTTVVVTGASGYIAGRLVSRLLAAGALVSASILAPLHLTCHHAVLR